MEEVTNFLSSGENVNGVYMENATCLFFCARSGFFEGCQLLIQGLCVDFIYFLLSLQDLFLFFIICFIQFTIVFASVNYCMLFPHLAKAAVDQGSFATGSTPLITSSSKGSFVLFLNIVLCSEHRNYCVI
jgi:hypothetical protein